LQGGTINIFQLYEEPEKASCNVLRAIAVSYWRWNSDLSDLSALLAKFQLKIKINKRRRRRRGERRTKASPFVPFLGWTPELGHEEFH